MKRLGADGFIGTYEAQGDFLVDVFSKDRIFEAWIYREGYSVKDLMFGTPLEQTIYGKKKTISLDDFITIVEGNLDSYLESYISDYCQGELISLGEWADAHGISPDTARQRAIRGAFKTAVKVGRNWLIAANEPLVDGRRKLVD